MHIPGQGFSHVRMKTDRNSRNRFTDLQGPYLIFVLRVAWFFFKPRPLRRIGGYGNKMRESRGDHRRLSLLIIIFHLCVA